MDPYLILFVAALICLLIPFLAWHFRRSRDLVERWANANAYTIVAIERRHICAGPFFWLRGRGHEVFRIVVRDSRGEQRGAYVRTGGWFLGQLSEDVTVKWDDSTMPR